MANPTAVAVDSAGNVYISDSFNNRVREVVAATGLIQTIAGNGALTFNGNGGLATSSGLGDPTGLQVGRVGQPVRQRCA